MLLLLCSLGLIVPQGLKWYYANYSAVSLDEDFALLERTLRQMQDAQKKLPEPVPVKPARHVRVQSFDINTATEEQLCTVKGIGSVLSKRIVKFRDKLGGFVSKQQYREVYGLKPEVVFPLEKSTYIEAGFQPRVLDINKAEVQVLAAHPYLTYQQAQAIVRQRDKHEKPFLAGELSQILDSSTLKRIIPYLAAQ